MVLAIDYGRKRMGLAISDETETIAVAMPAIISKTPKQTFAELKDIFKKYGIDKVVIGAPLGLEEKPTQMSEEVKKFSTDLLKHIKTDVSFWNETFTSHIAKKNLKKDNRSGKLDSESARIILQEYLDYQKEFNWLKKQ